MEFEARLVMSHRPLHSDWRGWQDGGIVQVNHNISQFLLDLTVVHSLYGGGSVCRNNKINENNDCREQKQSYLHLVEDQISIKSVKSTCVYRTVKKII